jgi:hypothetical protein
VKLITSSHGSSTNPLYPLDQLEEELGHAAAENEALRKSLEEVGNAFDAVQLLPQMVLWTHECMQLPSVFYFISFYLYFYVNNSVSSFCAAQFFID